MENNVYYISILNSSIILTGLGWILCTGGVFFFIVIFHCNLRTIQEPVPTTSRSNSWMMFFSRFKVVFAVTSSIIFVSVVFLIFNFDGSHDVIWLNVFCLVHAIIIFIFITRCYFSQNPNFKLYLSVYHHQPPPVLPWQLPSDFDPNSVILKYVLYENE